MARTLRIVRTGYGYTLEERCRFLFWTSWMTNPYGLWEFTDLAAATAHLRYVADDPRAVVKVDMDATSSYVAPDPAWDLDKADD